MHCKLPTQLSSNAKRKKINAEIIVAFFLLPHALASNAQQEFSSDASNSGDMSTPAIAKLPVGPAPGVGENQLPDNPFAGKAAAIQAGRRWFVTFNCYGCHGGHGGGGMGPSLRDKDWIYGGSDAAIFASISQGRANGMPAWGAQLPPRTIWELTSYIRSFGTSSEADPPQ